MSVVVRGGCCENEAVLWLGVGVCMRVVVVRRAVTMRVGVRVRRECEHDDRVTS